MNTKKNVKGRMIFSIAVAGMDGNRYKIGRKVKNEKNQAWYSMPIQGNVYIGKPKLSKSAKKLCIYIAHPMRNNKKEIIGVIKCTVGITSLSKKLQNIVIGQTGKCRIVDEKGKTIWAHDIEKTIQNKDDKKEVEKNQIILNSFGKDITEKEIGYYIASKDSLSISSNDEIGVLADSMNKMIIFLHEYAEATQRIAEGDLTTKVNTLSDDDEIGIALNKMITNLRC